MTSRSDGARPGDVLSALRRGRGDGTKVTDPDLFAKELLEALQDEDEQGTNAVHRAIDAAAETAVEQGARGISLPDDEDA